MSESLWVRFCGLPRYHFRSALYSAHLPWLCAWMPVQTLPKLANLQDCFLKPGCGGYFSLFTEGLLHVLSNCASRSIALLKLNLKFCPADDAALSSVRFGPASWTGSPTTNKSLVFSFYLFGKKEKQDGEDNETERDRESDHGPPTQKVFCWPDTPPSDHPWMCLALVFDLRL